MLHIHRTGIANVQQLTCAKGKASTLSAVNDINQSTDILILLLQEPWITETHQSPTAKNYDILVPTADVAKCATYV